MKNLVILLLLIAITGCTVTVKENMITTPEVKLNQDNLVKLEQNYKSTEIPTKDGSRLFSLYKYDPQVKTTLVLFHGNALNLTLQPWFGILDTLTELDVNILAIDYRGFGSSGGSASFINMKEDAVAAMAFLPKDQKLYVYGLSLGSVLATDVITDPRVQGAIIEGGLTNQTEMIDVFKANNTFGSFYNVKLDPNLTFDTAVAIQNSDKPILVIHGKQDQSIPLSMGQTIFAASSNQASDLYIVEEGGHCNAFAIEKETYLDKLRNFINS